MANKREKADYEKILKTILEMLDNEVAVEEVVTDFEKATWRAFQSVFLDARLFGCAFHWTEALFRNLKKNCLVHLYRYDANVQKVCKRAMCLHLLPPTKIKKVFSVLKTKAGALHIDQLDNFFTYIENTWMKTKGIWPPSVWSVFLQLIRTNNDAEGWHNKINLKGKMAGIHFYKLVPLLFRESEFVEVEALFLKQNQTTRVTRLCNELLQTNLFELWNSYDSKKNKGGSYKLLKEAANLYKKHSELTELDN
jgi:hypothetical protein